MMDRSDRFMCGFRWPASNNFTLMGTHCKFKTTIVIEEHYNYLSPNKPIN